MLQKQLLRPHLKPLFLVIAGIIFLGHVPKVNAQTTPPDSPIDLGGFYWIVRDEGPERMEVDLPVKVQVPAPGRYRLKGWILYNSGNKQLNESFYMLIRDANGQVFYPLDSNTPPAQYKVVPDDSVDGKHRVWRDAGLFYLPKANVDYTVEFHHYAAIWDEYPYFLFEQHYEGKRNAESLNVNWIGLDYEPVVNGAVALDVVGAQKQEVGGTSRDVVLPGESYTYDITVKNMQQDVLRGGRLVSHLPDSVDVANFSLTPDQIAGAALTWNLADIYPGDSLHITFDAAANGQFPPGYTPLVQTTELLLDGDVDLSDNRASAAVFLFNGNGWPKSPTADIGVTIDAKTDSFQVLNGDTIKYVSPGETFNLVLTLENNDSKDAANVFLYNQPPPFVSLTGYSQAPVGEHFGYALWQFATLAAGARISISATATVDTSLKTNGFPLNDVLMAFSENDDNLFNNVAEAPVRLAYEKPVEPSQNVDLAIFYQAFTKNSALIDGRVEQVIQPGDTIQYSLRLRNNGPRDAVNVRTWVDVPDSADFAGFSVSPQYLAFEKHFWFIDHLAAFEERDITFTGTARDSLPGLPFRLPSKAGVYVTADSTLDNNRDSTRVYVTSEIMPSLVDVSVSQNTIVDSMVVFAGDSVKFVQSGKSYRIEVTVKNISLVPAQNVRLLDLFPDSVAASNFNIAPSDAAADSAGWLFPTLPANEQRSISFTATVAGSMPVGANWLINKVVVSAENEIPGTQGDNAAVDSVLNLVASSPQLVDVSVRQTAVADSMITFQGDTVNFVPSGAGYRIDITVANKSEFEAANVRLIDVLPGSVTASNFSLTPSTIGPDSAAWLLASLPAQSDSLISFTATVAGSMPVGANWLINKVVVSAENEIPGTQGDNAAVDSVLNLVASSPQLVDVSVRQTAVTDSALIINGDSVNLVVDSLIYRIDVVVKNLGATAAENVRLVDLFPDSVTVAHFDVDPVAVNGDSAVWQFEALPAQEERTISFAVAVSDSMPAGDHWLVNRATVSAENEDENHLQNNVSLDSVLYRRVPGTVDLHVTQVAVTDSIVSEDGVDTPYVSRGEVFDILITVMNKSSEAANDVVLTEKLAELGVVLSADPTAAETFADSLQWRYDRIDARDKKIVTLHVQLDDNVPSGRHALNYRATISAANEDATGLSDNVALLTVINEVVPPPVTADIRSFPPAVDVGDSIHVDVLVDGLIASYDIWAILADGSLDSTFADNFIAAHSLTPDEWLSVGRGFTLQHLRTDAREEPIIFELRAVDRAGKLVTARTTSMVASSNYLVLDKNVFKSEQEDFLGIRFKLSYRRQATLDIYDLNGRHITRVAQDIYDGGWTTYNWNSLTTDGQKVGSGVYLVTLRSGEFNAFKKFILVR